METIYRDERFPSVEIRNCGGATFNIWVETGGDVRGYHSEGAWTNTDCFTHYEDDENGEMLQGVSPAHAAQAAQSHFDEMAEEEGS